MLLYFFKITFPGFWALYYGTFVICISNWATFASCSSSKQSLILELSKLVIQLAINKLFYNNFIFLFSFNYSDSTWFPASICSLMSEVKRWTSCSSCLWMMLICLNSISRSVLLHLFKSLSSNSVLSIFVPSISNNFDGTAFWLVSSKEEPSIKLLILFSSILNLTSVCLLRLSYFLLNLSIVSTLSFTFWLSYCSIFFCVSTFTKFYYRYS